MSNLQQLCPSCGRKLELPATAVGRQARCPACETVFTVGTPNLQDSSNLPDSTNLPDSLGETSPATDIPTPNSGPQVAPTPTGTQPAETQPLGTPPNPFARAEPEISPLGPAAGNPNAANPYAEAVGPAAAPFAPQDASNPYSPNATEVPDPSLLFEIRQVGIDQIFSPTFELFKNRIGEMLAIGGISFGVSFVLQIAQQIVAPIADAFDPMIGGLLISIVGFGSGFAGLYVTTGTIGASLAVLRNQPSPISRFFVSPIPMLKLLAGGIVLSLLAIPVLGVCAIPALAIGGEEGMVVSFIVGGLGIFIAMTVASIFLWAWPILVVDGHPGVIAPIKASLKISMANKGTSFLIMLIGIGCAIAGALMCCVGGVATYPFKILMSCVAYALMTGQINQVPTRQGAPSMY